MSKLIFVGYNLTSSPLHSKSLVSGEIKNANYLMAALARENQDILPISINLSGIPDVKLSIPKSSSKGVFRWVAEAKALSRIIDENSADGDVLYLTIPSYLPFLKLKKSLRIIVTAHGTYWPELLADLKYEKSLLKRWLHLMNGMAQLFIDKMAFKKATYLHSVSEYQVEEMVRTYKAPKEKIVAVRNGTDFVDMELQRDFEFIWVGRLAKKKNLKLFIEFINAVNAKSVCICVGNDYFAIDEESRQLVEKLANDNRYTVLRDVTDEELNLAMNKSKCLVVSSTGYESIPTVIFEGLASGCSVLAPSSWGVGEVEAEGLYKYKEGSISSLVDMFNKNVSENESNKPRPFVYKSVRWEERAKIFKSELIE